jgi:hypothetical protein
MRILYALRIPNAGAPCGAPAAFAAALAARSAAFFAASSGVGFRCLPSARRMSATCGLRWAYRFCLARRCASEYVVSASVPARLRAAVVLYRRNCASASSSSGSVTYASEYATRSRITAGGVPSARTRAVWFATATFVSSMNTGETDAAWLSLRAASAVSGMAKWGI